MIFPSTYGDVMRPLDVDMLPEPLLTQYQTIPSVKEWVHLADRVRRAEKVSSWTQWTADESTAYEIHDNRHFSRLRGYSEAEIDEFERYIALTHQLNLQMDDDYFCIDADFAIQQIVATPAYQEMEAILSEMSLMATTGRAPTSGIAL